jgi:hypothetical protein
MECCKASTLSTSRTQGLNGQICNITTKKSTNCFVYFASKCCAYLSYKRFISAHDPRKSVRQNRSTMFASREVLASFLDSVLDPQQDSSLPLIKLAHLVVQEQLLRERFLVTCLYLLRKVNKQLMLSCAWEGRVRISVLLQCSVCGNHITNCQMAKAGFQEVVFDGPFHEVV